MLPLLLKLSSQSQLLPCPASTLTDRVGQGQGPLRRPLSPCKETHRLPTQNQAHLSLLAMKRVTPSAIGSQHLCLQFTFPLGITCLNLSVASVLAILLMVGGGGVAFLISRRTQKSFLYTDIKLKFEFQFHQNNTKHMVTNKIVQETILRFIL